MKRIRLGFAIAALTFIVGITAATLWVINRGTSTKPDQISAAADSPLSFCDLVQNPEPYNSKVVRLRAILIGYHEIALSDPACGREVEYIRADFDAGSRQTLIRAMDALNGAGFERANFGADLILSGRFEKFPDADCRIQSKESGMPNRNYINYCKRLVVSNVAHVEAVATNVAWPA